MVHTQFADNTARNYTDEPQSRTESGKQIDRPDEDLTEEDDDLSEEDLDDE
ncbi:MAG: hypothetical protein HY305_00975 [Sphingobacteriales bacterium]|nr:hypothetical protein [Sphingobacteriales bacterium]